MNSLKVLVVDDNVINQKVAVKMLERSDIITGIACNGQEAVEEFKKQRYDMILMDVQMPVMDGLAATRTIRLLERNEFHTTIIALTANAMNGDRERCLEAGMDDYLSKPIRQQDIDMMIGKWLSSTPVTVHSKTEYVDPAMTAFIDPERIEQIKEIGDADLLHELLGLYLQDLREFLLDVRAAQAENNFQKIFESAHKLKGSSANLGIEAIRQACVSLEQCAKEHDSAKIEKQFSAIRGTVEQVRLHIVTVYPVR